VSDFLSNLIARSFADAPAIRPRVPSLFEPTATEFFDEPELSASLPESESLPAEQVAAGKTPSKKSRPLAQEHRLRVDAPDRETVPPLVSREKGKLIVPSTSSVSDQDHSDSAKHASEAFSETRSLQSSRHERSTPVERRASKSAPIIRVTIGRVEVRAVHPPAANPKPAKPATPKLSLDDYLRKRARGFR
jgi:hypothetical protein